MALLQPGIAACFLASGAAGLLYQIAWMRYMALFLGQTSIAIILVLMAFLGGLALGNALLGARADRVAWLYFINSAGAVGGCALAEFWAIPTLGLANTVRFAGLLNLAVAAAALNAYRSLRSSFHLPDQGLPRRAAERLVELDSPNTQLHQLHLAELAWDRGDDRAFNELAVKALNPDPPRPVAGDFSADPLAPHEVLWRLIENARRAGRLDQARGWARQAVESGHALPRTGPTHPRLDMLVRLVSENSRTSASNR